MRRIRSNRCECGGIWKTGSIDIFLAFLGLYYNASLAKWLLQTEDTLRSIEREIISSTVVGMKYSLDIRKANLA